MPSSDPSSGLSSGMSSNVSSSMSGISGSSRAFGNVAGQPHPSAFAATMQQEMHPTAQPSVQTAAQSGTPMKSVAAGSATSGNATASGASLSLAASSSTVGSSTGAASGTSQPATPQSVNAQPANVASPATIQTNPARVAVTTQTLGGLTGASADSATGSATNTATSSVPDATKRKAEAMSPAGNGSGTSVSSTQAMVVVPVVVAISSSSPSNPPPNSSSNPPSSSAFGANVSNLSGSALPLRGFAANGSTQNAMKGTPIGGVTMSTTTNAPGETETAGAAGMTGTTGAMPNLGSLRSEALAVAPGISPEALPKGVGSEIGPKTSTPTIASAAAVNVANAANATISKGSASAVQSNAQGNVQDKAQTGSAFPAQSNGVAASSTGTGISSVALAAAASGNAGFGAGARAGVGSGSGAGAGSGSGGSATGNTGSSGNAGSSATAALPNGATSQDWTHAPGTANVGTINPAFGGTIAAVSSANSVPGVHGIAPAGAPPVAGQGVAGVSANPLTATGGGNFSLPQGARLPSASSPTASDAFAALDHVSSEPNRILYATPHQLAVGVSDPQLGWLEVRAERSGGQLMAQVAADSASSHAVLAAALPAMTSYLQEQRAGVQSLAVAAQLAGHAGQSPGQGTPHQNTAGGGGQQPPATESGLSGTSALGAVAGVGAAAVSGVFAAGSSVGHISSYLQRGHQVSLHA